jgi:acetyltransferase-like isoleucine patch superfamily enzyme
MLQRYPVLAAQAASSLHPCTQPSLAPKSQKEDMLPGERFLPDTAQLVEERALSSQASFRFNAAVHKDPVERSWLFERIIAAEWVYTRVGARQVTSRLGRGVDVTAPFYCNYGYNISIGDNVVIGPGCQLLDSDKIAIGCNTKIGARVTISFSEERNDGTSPEGNKHLVTARGVSIGENVYIGDGCIVIGDVRIGDNAMWVLGLLLFRQVYIMFPF